MLIDHIRASKPPVHAFSGPKINPAGFLLPVQTHSPNILLQMLKEAELMALINDVFLFAKYLRDEKPTWNPKIVELS